MKDGNEVRIGHVREALDIIVSHLGTMSFEEFKESVKVQDAVVRRIEIIGEAVNNISEDFQNLHPEVEWADIIGMRNILAHEYFAVDLKVIWRTVKNDLPRLKEALNKLKI